MWESTMAENRIIKLGKRMDYLSSKAHCWRKRLEGIRFSSSVTEEDVQTQMDSLGL